MDSTIMSLSIMKSYRLFENSTALIDILFCFCKLNYQQIFIFLNLELTLNNQ